MSCLSGGFALHPSRSHRGTERGSLGVSHLGVRQSAMDGWLRQQTFLSRPGSCSSRSRVPLGWPLWRPLQGEQMACHPRVPTRSSLRTCLISSSYKDAGHTGVEPMPVTSFCLHHFLKDPSAYTHPFLGAGGSGAESVLPRGREGIFSAARSGYWPEAFYPPAGGAGAPSFPLSCASPGERAGTALIPTETN